MVINKSAPFSPLNSLTKDDDSLDFTADSSYDITPKSKRKLSLLRKSVSLKHLTVPERFTKSVNNLSLSSQAPSSDTSNRTGADSLDAAETHNKMKLQQKKDMARRKSNPKSLHVVKVKGGHVELHSSASCFQNSGNSMIHEEEDNDSSKQPPRKPKRHSSRGGGLRRTSSRREGRRESSVRRGSNSNNLTKAQVAAMNSSSKSRGKTRSKSKSRRNKEDKKMDGSNTSTVASARRMHDSSSNLTSSMRRSNTTSGDNSGSNLLISPKRRAKSQDAKSTKAKFMLSTKDDDSASSLDDKSNSKRRARSHSRARKPGSDHSSSKKRVRSASRGNKNSGPNNKKTLEGGGSDHSTSNSNNGRGTALRRARSIRDLDRNDVDCNRSASFSSGSARSFHHSFNEHIGASSGTNRRASRLALARAANQLAQNKQGGRSESQRALLRSDIKKTQAQGESSSKRGSMMQNESKKAQVQSEAKKNQVQDDSIPKIQSQQGEPQGMIDGSNKENTGKKAGIPPRPKNFRRAKSQSSLSMSSHATLRSDTSLGELTPPPASTPAPASQQPPSTRRPRGGRPSLKKAMSQSALMAGRSRKHHALDTLLELEPEKAGGSQDEDNSIVSTMTTYSAIERAVQDAVQEAISDALSQHTSMISNAAATNLIQRLQSGLVTG